MRVEVVEPVKTVQLNYISNRSTNDCFTEMVEEAAYLCISLGPWLLVGLGYQKHSITWLWVVLNSQDGLMLAFHLCFHANLFSQDGGGPNKTSFYPLTCPAWVTIPGASHLDGIDLLVNATTS